MLSLNLLVLASYVMYCLATITSGEDEDYDNEEEEACRLSTDLIALVNSTSCYLDASYQEIDVRIIGGLPAEKYSLNFMVNLDHCGGTLIDACHVLTAAHCIKDSFDITDYHIVLGEFQTDQEDIDKKFLNASYIKVHPDYKSTKSYDIALITLEECVEVDTEAIDVICLPYEDSSFYGSEALIAGWGAPVIEGSEKTSEILLQANVTVLDDTDCDEAYGVEFDNETMICAKGFGVDTCQGDSGGPLFSCSDNFEAGCLQIGISSFGHGCADPDYPGIYTNVALLMEWIDKERFCN